MGLFDSIKQGFADAVLGPDTSGAASNTANAYMRLQDAINQDYSQQKKMFETNPANKGQTWQAPSPTDRLRDQIDAMVMSGDPTLQARGVQLLGTIQPSGSSAPAAIQEYQYATSQGYKGTFADWKKEQKAGTTVNIGQGDKAIPISDLSKLTMPDGSPVPPGTTYGELPSMGVQLAQTATQAKAGTSTDILSKNLGTLYDVIDAADTPMEGAGTVLRTQPGIAGSIANAALNAAGMPMNSKAIKFNTAVRTITGQVTNLMNGAGASEGERDYWASLQPQFTDDVAARKEKFNNMIDFAQSMAERARQQGVRDVPDFSRVKRFDTSSKKTVSWSDLR